MNLRHKHFWYVVLLLFCFQSFPINAFITNDISFECASKNNYTIESRDNDQGLILIVAAPAAPAIAGVTIAAAAEIAAGAAVLGGFLYNVFWKSDAPPNTCTKAEPTGGPNGRCRCMHMCGPGCDCLCWCPCGQKNKEKEEEANKHPHGIYRNDPKYHHHNSRGDSKGGKSAAPKNGQTALDNSIPMRGEGNGRIGVSEGQIVELKRTSEGVFHGFVITVEEMKKHDKYDGMLKQLKEAGLLDAKGRPLK